jgi:hypothetical protein
MRLAWISIVLVGFENYLVSKYVNDWPNKSMMTNRHCPTALATEWKLATVIHARPLLTVAVAYHYRSA